MLRLKAIQNRERQWSDCSDRALFPDEHDERRHRPSRGAIARLQCKADRDGALMILELTSEKIKVVGVVHARA